MTEIPPESIQLMPRCALCKRQAWTWVRDTTMFPIISVALCDDHAPNGAPTYTLDAIAQVRRSLAAKMNSIFVFEKDQNP